MHIVPRIYHSPLTGDVWTDARPAIGTLAGLANFLNEKRPRRKPPEGHDAAIAAATDAAAAFAGIPKITRTGLEGIPIADAYWKAKDAKRVLTRLADDGVFLQHQSWWAEWHRWRRERRELLRSTTPISQAPASWGTWARTQLITDASSDPDVDDPAPPTFATRAARLAWWAVDLTEKAASNGIEMDKNTPADVALTGALAELDAAGIGHGTAASVERVWRFVVAAGRLPRAGVDDDLLAAFEAALMAGADDFAANLAKHGHGFVNEP